MWLSILRMTVTEKDFFFYIFTLIQAIFADIITCVSDVSVGFSAARAWIISFAGFD